MWTFVYLIIFSMMNSAFAETKPSTATIPICKRPIDMSIPTEVLKYDLCLKKKRLYCDKNEGLKECIAYRLSERPKTLSSTVTADALASDRCTILRDGSYKCKQDPLRFVIKETPRATQPQSSPAAPANSSSDNAETPTTDDSKTTAPGPNSDDAPPPIAPPTMPR